jgi:hypothetical protein
VDSDKTKEYIRRMRQFLIEKVETPDVSGEVIVRRQELEGIAVAAGVDKQWAWEMFKWSKGLFWEGSYMPESRSEERGYTAAWLWRGPP